MINYENGFYRVENSEYHSLRRYISAHDIIYASRSAAHYAQRIEEPTEEPRNANLNFGAAFHMYYLEPHKYRETVRIIPKIDRRTKIGKEAFMAFEMTCRDDSIVITEEQDQRIAAMTLSLLRKKEVRTLTEDALYEISGFYNENYNETTLGYRIRPDIYSAAKALIVDLKTVVDARNFFSDCVRYGYFVQAYHYLKVASKIDDMPYKYFYWICVEKDPPFEVMVYKAHFDFLESKVLNAYTVGLSNILSYKETGKPKGYTENILELNDNYSKQDHISYEIF